jgi:hypothetical protein
MQDECQDQQLLNDEIFQTSINWSAVEPTCTWQDASEQATLRSSDGSLTPKDNRDNNTDGNDTMCPTRRAKTALHRAASAGNDRLVCLLLDYGAEVSVNDSSGKTPLQLAAEAGVKAW